MILLKYKFKSPIFLLISAILFFTSCNKDVEQFTEATTVTPTGPTLGETMAATPSDSLYNRLIIKSGLSASLNNKAKTFTMFVPDNDGMKLFINAISGIPLTDPDAVFSGFITANLPSATAAAIVNYNTVPQKILFGNIPTTFPDFQLPTNIILDPTNPLVRMTTFPSRRTTYSYVNNIPVTAVDAVVANGVIHHTATVVVPPSKFLDSIIYRDPHLSYFTAAVARADSGQVGLNKIDSLLKYPVLNMTVLAPNDSAFQTLIYGLVFGKVFALTGNAVIADAQATAAVALGPAFFSTQAFYGDLPAATVRGILVYHILASQSGGVYTPNLRAFSVNFPTTPIFVPTLVNTAFAAHPGMVAVATFNGPVVSSLHFTGLGTFPPGGTPYSDPPANAVTMDEHAVNGVVHIIDKILLPQ